MRIIIDIGHPGHVHFYKNFYWEMKKLGHEILVTACDKEVTIDLLKAYNIPFVYSCKKYKGLKMAYELLYRDNHLYQLTKKFKPDFLTGVGGTYAAHVSKLTGVKSIIFYDTEHAKFANQITYPFADLIVTPECYTNDLGPKQVRYNGYHEIAYLHPKYFSPDPSVLKELGLSENERLILLRFVSWGATHDVGQAGIKDKKSLVQELAKYGRVLITSEEKLDTDLEKYKIKISPEKLHHLLYYATLYIGEGATTASECAVLGTPAIYTNSLKLGYLDEEEKKYGLVYNFSNKATIKEDAYKRALELLQDDNLKASAKQKVEKMLKEKIDVTEFMIKLFMDQYRSKQKRN